MRRRWQQVEFVLLVVLAVMFVGLAAAGVQTTYVSGNSSANVYESAAAVQTAAALLSDLSVGNHYASPGLLQVYDRGSAVPTGTTSPIPAICRPVPAAANGVDGNYEAHFGSLPWKFINGIYATFSTSGRCDVNTSTNASNAHFEIRSAPQ